MLFLLLLQVIVLCSHGLHHCPSVHRRVHRASRALPTGRQRTCGFPRCWGTCKKYGRALRQNVRGEDWWFSWVKRCIKTIHVSQTNLYQLVEMKWMMFQDMILHCKALIGRGQYGLMRWNLLWIMPLVQDQSLNLLTSSPESYHCTMDVPANWWKLGFSYYIRVHYNERLQHITQTQI